MTTIEAFETALKDVVKAKRLSQSKMKTLTDIALKGMENDTQMVSILYRTHKGLSSSAKIWSLYVFDALARAARNQVNKHKVVANVNSASGNCATFLLKIEGILDGLFNDLVSSQSTELQEKAKKILDIWAKSNTFPAAVLSPLFTLLTETEKEKELAQADQSAQETRNQLSALAVPPSQADVVQSTLPSPAIAGPVQSALLALLSQAAHAAGGNTAPSGQTAPNINPVPTLALDPNQLALLQQLTQTAKRNTLPSQPVVPVPASIVPSLAAPNAVPVVPVHEARQSLPYRDDHYGPPNAHAPQRESEQQHHGGGRFAGPADRGREYYRDDYTSHNAENQNCSGPDNLGRDRREITFNHRGGYHDRGGGGPWRGRGRGFGRWEERGERGHRDDPHRDNRNRDFGHVNTHDPRGHRRSRSRSPPARHRDGGQDGGMGNRSFGQDFGRRPSYDDRRLEQEQLHGQRYVYAPGPSTDSASQFDEFGRELRAGSASGANSDSASVQIHQPSDGSPLPPRSASVTVSDRGSVTPETSAAGAGPHSHLRLQDSQQYTFPSEPSTSASASLSSAVSPSTSVTSLAPTLVPVPTQELHGVGLDVFDRQSFDPAQPDSWDALGKAWTVTHGSAPTQEELMQFVLVGMPLPQSVLDPHTGPGSDHGRDRHQYHPPDALPQDRQSFNREFEQRGGWRGRGDRGGGVGNHGGTGRYGRGRGGDYGRGRGGFGGDRGGYADHGHSRGDDGGGEYGNGRGAFSAGGRGYGHYQETDAVTLTGGGEEYSWQQDQLQEPLSHQVLLETEEEPAQGSGDGGGSAGKMKKVGDGWMFVRGA